MGEVEWGSRTGSRKTKRGESLGCPDASSRTLPTLCSGVWRAGEGPGVADESWQANIATNHQSCALTADGMMKSSKLIYRVVIHLISRALQHINHCSHSWDMLLPCSKSFPAAQGASTTKISINSLLGAPSCILPPVPRAHFSRPSCTHRAFIVGVEGLTVVAQLQGEGQLQFIVFWGLYRREVKTLESLRAVGMCTVGLSKNLATATVPFCHVSHQLTHYVFLYCKVDNFICPYISKFVLLKGRFVCPKLYVYVLGV